MFVVEQRTGPPWLPRVAPPFTALFLRVGSTNLRYVLGGGTLLALHNVELDLFAFGERLEAATVDGGVVNETILLAVLRGNESKTLCIVEPLHSSGGTHAGTSSCCLFVGSPEMPSPPTVVLTHQIEKDLVLSRSLACTLASRGAHPCAKTIKI